ncbi:hypothetical protein GOODEAATRI_007207 [Goodea atripinnis]|uniref:Uncharacterized protein n=1 Tax=Goodea atripinnis TaxID=208336 RepID=A0ABV0PC37_9TELE
MRCFLNNFNEMKTFSDSIREKVCPVLHPSPDGSSTCNRTVVYVTSCTRHLDSMHLLPKKPHICSVKCFCKRRCSGLALEQSPCSLARYDGLNFAPRKTSPVPRGGKGSKRVQTEALKKVFMKPGAGVWLHHSELRRGP